MLTFLLVIFLTGLYFYIKSIYTYWPRNGFDDIDATFPFGNLDSVRKGLKSFGCAIQDLYNATSSPIVGIYLFFRPALLIRDSEIVKNIFTKDFNNFHDRGIYVDENDQLSESLFALEGTKWKALRSKLAPSFSSGKIKGMFLASEMVGKQMEIYLNSIIPDDKNEKKVIDVKDVTYRYAADIIASTIFGIETNSFKDKTNEFFMIKDKINENTFFNKLLGMALFLCPQIVKFIPKFIINSNPARKFMVKIVKETIDFREKNNFVRKDLMQSLIQLRNTGKINIDDNIWDVETAAENLKSMTIEQCAAQAFLFYIAGLETSASTLAFLLYELAQNEEIYLKLEKNINETLEKHNGQITYDSIQEMSYLELCINETMRKYPGLPVLNRICTEDYKIETENVIIKKGTPIIISLLGMHRDETYFPEPLKFLPERFLEDQKNYNESAYMPFGDGPRHCIAIRLGKINVKLGAVMILRKFNIEAIEKKEIEFDNYSVALMPKGGINLKLSKK
ncbi:probable cytochrome P450 6d5 [Condylostylus longicornis]|uniref:probable cytochrome P450 6d5 n=1 Tax=Condylostylus longicornis TaxID=2530218 RepID=UPI00244D9EED|nr:probable cytochrome P450 6d5 [Condylostylus longicornis]